MKLVHRLISNDPLSDCLVLVSVRKIKSKTMKPQARPLRSRPKTHTNLSAVISLELG